LLGLRPFEHFLLARFIGIIWVGLI
jgi:hypothetical protein